MRKLPRRRREDGGDAEAPAVVDRVGKIADVVDGGVSGWGSQWFGVLLNGEMDDAVVGKTE